jgi:hypothetical protein
MDLGVLHDANLIGVAYLADRRVRLAFVTDSGSNVNIVLIGVQRFIATNLLDGNIVLDVRSTKLGNIELADIGKVLKEAFSVLLPEREIRQNAEWLEEVFDQIRAGHLHFLSVEPSYGAEVVAVCTDILVEP